MVTTNNCKFYLIQQRKKVNEVANSVCTVRKILSKIVLDNLFWDIRIHDIRQLSVCSV